MNIHGYGCLGNRLVYVPYFSYLSSIFISQMIYKKTQLPCPLPFLNQHSANLSMNASDMPGLYALHNSSAQKVFSRADVSPAVLGSHQATGVHYEPHPDDDDKCTPKYFVFNSQVHWGQLEFSLFCSLRLSVCNL